MQRLFAAGDGQRLGGGECTFKDYLLVFCIKSAYLCQPREMGGAIALSSI
ncbi:hypothetical protein JOY44_23260 [Phormidium sp. CLA17]|nr:hypothetical protein [Leptolyngbya sp. Cla-17]